MQRWSAVGTLIQRLAILFSITDLRLWSRGGESFDLGARMADDTAMGGGVGADPISQTNSLTITFEI